MQFDQKITVTVSNTLPKVKVMMGSRGHGLGTTSSAFVLEISIHSVKKISTEGL